MKFSTLTLQRNDAIARLTLNRPGALNAINGAMLDEIRAALAGIADDDSIRVVVFDSACERAFSAGIDVAYVKDLDA